MNEVQLTAFKVSTETLLPKPRAKISFILEIIICFCIFNRRMIVVVLLLVFIYFLLFCNFLLLFIDLETPMVKIQVDDKISKDAFNHNQT